MSRQRPVLSIVILIAVPAVVALLVTLLVLWIWDSGKPEETVALPTLGPTAQIPPRVTQPPAPAAGGGDGTAGSEAGLAPEGEAPAPVEARPGCENPVHTVEAGDTISTLSLVYEVSMDDIILINQMRDPEFDPDFLNIGQELVIPVCGVATPTPTVAPTNTAVPTAVIPSPIPSASPLPPGAIQVAILGVFNIGDVTKESVEIINEGSPIDLEDWTLTNGRGDTFVFPSFRLFSGGKVTVYTGVGENTPIDLYWGLSGSVWRIGDVASLFDADGELQAEFEVEG